MSDTDERLLPLTRAAKYCGVPRSRFRALCKVRPIVLYEKAHPKYDIHDLDKWIDSVKAGGKQEVSDDGLLDNL